MSTPILLTPEAAEQIRRVDSWWRGNRPLAPNLFVEEFAAACELLGGAPLAGKRYDHAVRGSGPDLKDTSKPSGS